MSICLLTISAWMSGSISGLALPQLWLDLWPLRSRLPLHSSPILPAASPDSCRHPWCPHFACSLPDGLPALPSKCIQDPTASNNPAPAPARSCRPLCWPACSSWLHLVAHPRPLDSLCSAQPPGGFFSYVVTLPKLLWRFPVSFSAGMCRARWARQPAQPSSPSSLPSLWASPAPARLAHSGPAPHPPRPPPGLHPVSCNRNALHQGQQDLPPHLRSALLSSMTAHQWGLPGPI